MSTNTIDPPVRRGDVEIGDVIEVPPGVDRPGAARYRVRVDAMSSRGAAGIKVKADGSPLLNRSREPIESDVPWYLLSQVILHKAPPVEAPVLDANGDPVHVPAHIVVDDTFRAWMAGRVPAACGHYIAASEARAGFDNCERC